MRHHRLSPGFALELWPALEPFIDRAAKFHPFLDAEGLKLLVTHGYATVFITTNDAGVLGFAAVEVIQYPQQRVANIIFAGGGYGFLASLTGELMSLIEAWAREQGATSISLTGRPGWMRVAKRFGWTSQPQVAVHKELTDERRRGHTDPEQ